MAGAQIPGPLGSQTRDPYLDQDTLALILMPPAGPIGLFPLTASATVGSPVPLAGDGQAPAVAANTAKLSEEERLLAALVYGEGSTQDVFEEMAGIGAVVVRQAQARKQTVLGFLGTKEARTFSFVLIDGSERFNKLKNATEAAIAAHTGMSTAVRAARHALTNGTDYSNGGYFWDGVDFKTNYAKHPKKVKGITFTDKAHDIFNKGDHKIPTVTTYWQPANKVRGTYDCTYESTAAHGQTIFWKYTNEFIKATGNKVYK